IIAGDGDMLVCLTRVEADLVLHAYPRGATTPEFQQQLESMIEPRWMRIGRQTWFLNTGDTLYLAK
ncbi:MAG: hypothetical protein Q4Q03_03090, partial [Bowdeniella nasicola]|nr:hypothetical protein [Bowdeniella nasicola]